MSTSAILDELASGRIPRASINDDAEYADQLKKLISYMTSLQQFTIALANGDLSCQLPTVGGPVSGSLKSLHASLKHLTWQTKQIAGGDFSQRVDFMGEFSDSFNIMVERLEASRGELESMNLRLQDDNLKLRNLTEALSESEERFRHIAENVSDVIWTLDSSMERFTYISPSIAQLRGLSVKEALQEPIEQAMTPESLAYMRQILSNWISSIEKNGGAESVSEIIEISQICKGGTVIHVEVVISAVTTLEGNLKEFVGISRDISVRKRAEARMKYQITHDAATGLYNRAFFDDELERLTHGNHFPVSIIVADLDGLKFVNDTMGHEAGDQLIKGAAEIFHMAFRGNDIIARTGGDEFVILLPEMDQDGVSASLDRIRNSMQSYNSENEGPLVSISLGSATAFAGEEIALTLKSADERMYADKKLRKKQRTS